MFGTKLKEKYIGLHELRDELKHIKQQKKIKYDVQLFVEDDQVMVYRWNEDGDTIVERIYYQLEKDGSLIYISTKERVEQIVNVLAKHVDPVALLRAFLEDTPPEDIIEIYDRVVTKKGKVVSVPDHCYSLNLGGKKGKPYEMCIIRQ